jgi:hypothetical protein
MYILMFFCQKSGHCATHQTIPSTQIYCCYRLPEGRRSLAGLWSAVQCSASQDSISFWFREMQNAGGGRFSVGLALLWTAGAAPFWSNSRNRSTLLHTCQIPGEFNLHLVNVKSKLRGSLYLMGFPDPDSIRVNQLVV